MNAEYYVVVTQYDVNPMKATVDCPAEGPIVHETYIAKAGSREHAIERAKFLGNNYGWAKIAKLTIEDVP